MLQTPEAGTHVMEADGSELVLATSRAFFAAAPAAVVLVPEPAAAPEDNASGSTTAPDATVGGGTDEGGPAHSGAADSGLAQAAAQRAEDLGIPLLLASADGGDANAVGAELQRLGATSVIAYGALPEGLSGDLRVIDGTDPDAELPRITAAAAAPGLAVVARPQADSAAEPDPAVGDKDDAGGAAEADGAAKADRAAGEAVARAAALANARAAGAAVHEMASADPRARGNLAFFQQQAKSALYAIGGGFGPEKQFAALAATAATGPELPGGGQIVFPQRRMVALYGTPGTSALGLLGEQGVDASIRRVKKLAADYQPYSKEKVQPAFEIIATVASAVPGKDGKYSSYAPVAQLEPWVKAARKAGVYVVLDLQPGRNDFLTQAKYYEKLLRYPNVGLAYDPEWRLKPGQRHMVQIGSVSAAELNRTNDWLAALTRRNKLPQKVVILHQFQLRMIRDRASLDTSHPELALVLHADGNGSPGQKMATWNNLRHDLPRGIRMAWKNFIDEDSPTFTPKQTFAVDPKPWFVSYQ